MQYRWRVSRKGVPHVLLRSDAGCVSMCYFRDSKIYRVFAPYPYTFGKGQRYRRQTRGDFKTLEEAWRFCRDLLK